MPHAPIESVADLSCPLLGILGAHDARSPVEAVAATDEAIKAAGKSWEYEIHPAPAAASRRLPAQLRRGSVQHSLAADLRLLSPVPVVGTERASDNRRGGFETRPKLSARAYPSKE